MVRKSFVLITLACFCGSTLFADFTMEETTKITGGAAMGAMKIAGAFSKQARQGLTEPILTTVVVKGDRMAHISPHHTSIIDLNNETITNIDSDKKQYSVMTFAEMKEAMDQMSKKMAEKRDPNAPEMKFSVSVKNTGQSKVINGFSAKETIMTMTMEGTDAKTAQTGAMNVVTDMWLAPKTAGYSEVQNFYKRMALKMDWTPNALGGMLNRPEYMKGMAEAAKEMSKIDGVPVMTVTRLGGVAGGPGGPGNAGAQQQAAAQQPRPDAGEAAGNAGGSAIGRKLGGGLGGLAGGALGGGVFGRKKKNQDEQQSQPEPANQPPSGSADASGALLETTTEVTSFTSAPVDSAKFEIPAGFKKVESEMSKGLRK